MSVKIRLARFGKHKVPFYHIVATDSRNRRDSKFLEKLGTFNPLLDDDNEEKIVLKKDRVKYWLGVGAIPTERVAILLLKQKIEGAEKFKPSFTPVAKGVKSKSNKGKMPEETAASSTNEETTNNSQEEVKTE